MEEMPMEIEDGPSGSGGMRRSRNVSETKRRPLLRRDVVLLVIISSISTI